MDAAEVVIGEPESYSSGMILDFLGERIRQPRETSNCHSNAEILALYKQCAEVLWVGLPMISIRMSRDLWLGATA